MVAVLELPLNGLQTQVETFCPVLAHAPGDVTISCAQFSCGESTSPDRDCRRDKELSRSDSSVSYDIHKALDKTAAVVAFNSLRTTDFAARPAGKELLCALLASIGTSEECNLPKASEKSTDYNIQLWEFLQTRCPNTNSDPTTRVKFVSIRPSVVATGVAFANLLPPLAALSLLELSTCIELLALPDCQLPVVSDSRQPVETCIRNVQQLMAWMFADSKVSDRKWPAGISQADGSQLIWAMALSSCRVRRAVSELKDCLKPEFRGHWQLKKSGQGPEPELEVQDSRRDDWRFGSIADAMSVWLKCFHDLINSVDEFNTRIVKLWIKEETGKVKEVAKLISCEDPQHQQHNEDAIKLCDRIKKYSPDETCCAVDFEAVKGESLSIDQLSAGLICSLKKMSASLSSLFDSITIVEAIRRVNIFNNNFEKIIQKKKKIQWKIPSGQGVEEYLTSVRPSIAKSFDQRNSFEDIFPICLNQQAALEVALTAKNQMGRKPKTAKGAQDFEPKRMLIRECLLDKAIQIFRSYGAQPIDTPVFELKEVLTNKYGEDQKLIFDLKDQGGEQLALRYDLTVPFARYCASHGVEKMKRYQIGKVYRRDEPQMNRGRCREFYSCDIDIAGVYDNMVADAEAVTILCHSLSVFGPLIGNFKIKLSHRVFLDGMMEFCGVPEDKIRAISSAIDKLDKEPWDVVKTEMVNVKGLDEHVADRISHFVKISGSISTVKKSVYEIEGASTNKRIAQGIDELERMVEMISASGYAECINFDLSLARGLDYYTGPVYEAVIVDQMDPTTAVGSIAGGGRYDNLIGMFATKQIPACGFSLGIERIFRLAEAKLSAITATPAAGSPNTVDTISGAPVASVGEKGSSDRALGTADVFVCSAGDDMLKERMQIGGIIRRAGINCEYALAQKIKFAKQFAQVMDQKIPIAVIFGDEELKNKVVKVREFYFDGEVSKATEGSDKDETVLISELIDVLNSKLDRRRRARDLLSAILFGSSNCSKSD